MENGPSIREFDGPTALVNSAIEDLNNQLNSFRIKRTSEAPALIELREHLQIIITHAFRLGLVLVPSISLFFSSVIFI